MTCFIRIFLRRRLLALVGLSGLVNFNFNTGVEQALQNQIGPAGDPLRPPDGGFGTDPLGGFDNEANVAMPFRIDGSFGNGTFNTPPLVEAAAKGVFFHNGLVDTIEEAVRVLQQSGISRFAFGFNIERGSFEPYSNRSPGLRSRASRGFSAGDKRAGEDPEFY